MVGPTATGKSDLGVALAHALDGEVINADAMQLYRGMDVGTAKLSLLERQGVAHHLLDIWDVTEPASVAEYQQLARAAVMSVSAAGKVPIVVGGSGLYVRAVLDDMTFPGTDPAIRAKYERRLAEVGVHALHRDLAAVDPAAAAAILPSNNRRIVRALEVIELTGEPFQATMAGVRPYFDAVYLGLDYDATRLDLRVSERVDRMWAQGLVDEVRQLVGRGLREGRTASAALGYRQVLAMFDGESTEAEAKAHTVTRTRQFVRRQRSWFRRDARISWLDPTVGDVTAAAADLIAAGPDRPVVDTSG